MSDNANLAAHLRLFSDMGVNGVSRDASWRERVKVSVTVSPGPEGPGLQEESTVLGAAAPPNGAADLPNGAADLQVRGTPDAQAFAALPRTPPADALAALRAHIGDCTRCQLGHLGR
jgi:hypothetical protein